MAFRAACASIEPRASFRMYALVLAALCAGCAPTDEGVRAPAGSDVAWWHADGHSRAGLDAERRYAKWTYSSVYVGMRDGTRIAVDVYLPKDLPPGERVPAILSQTRYCRSFEYRRPLDLLLGGPRDLPFVERFVRHGYAVVVADARGTGASFGNQSGFWSPDEVRDEAEVVDWMVRQPWSNGRVGALDLVPGHRGRAAAREATPGGQGRGPAVRPL